MAPESGGGARSPGGDYRLTLREWLDTSPGGDRLLPWAFFATGAALVIHILTPLPLWLSTAVTVTGGVVICWGLVRRRGGAAEQTRQLVLIGLQAGVLGLIAYDAARWAWVWSTGSPANPFEALPLFGAGLVGTSAPLAVRWIAGWLFHVANGIGFAIAFVLCFRGRANVWWGIAWGVLLEVIVLLLYPVWLQVDALREFATVSVLGHVVYGATLGLVARRRLSSVGLTADLGRSQEHRS